MAAMVHKHSQEELPQVQGQGSSREELPHVQGKRNPSKMVGTERGHQRADRLKPQSQTTSQSDHTDHVEHCHTQNVPREINNQVFEL